jgi:hypothetical protein
MLAEEQPGLYARLCAELKGQEVELHVDAELFWVGFGPGEARLREAGGIADVRISMDRWTVQDQLEARRTLAQAVLDGSVEMVGPLGVLAACHAGFVTYVHGAVRCPSFPSLLERFHALCRGGPGPVSQGGTRESIET